MCTYTQIIYHIVFATKNREKTLTENNQELLYKYIAGTLLNKKCHVHQIGCIEDYIHILTHPHTDVCVSDLVRDVKMSATDFIKRNKLFPHFRGWQNGYGAFSYATRDKKMLINYIQNQKQHHATKDFKRSILNS